jgi:hypothetical protein
VVTLLIVLLVVLAGLVGYSVLRRQPTPREYRRHRGPHLRRRR